MQRDAWHAMLLPIALLLPSCATGPRYEGKPLSTWAEQLADRNSGTQAEAVSALADTGEESVPHLVKALASKDRYARLGAAQALSQVLVEARAGSANERALAAMTATLGDPEVNVREIAIECLGNLGPRAAGMVEPLAALLADHTGSIRLQTALALNEIGNPEAKAAIPVSLLIDALTVDDATAYPRDYAAQVPRVLGSLGPRASAAGPALIKALEYDDRSCRQDAAWALGQLGPSAAKALPALEKARSANKAALTMDADFDRQLNEAIQKITAEMH
jgi:HEAT repeat protein